MSKIKNIKAREIKDSRGNSTVEAEMETDAGVFFASVPSGASSGKNEALELRDADGKGVSSAIKNINEIIAPALKNSDPADQEKIDKIMIDLDATENKSRLGANAVLAVSMAVCRAGAASKKIPLYKHISEIFRGPSSGNPEDGPRKAWKFPLPMFNFIEGGAHAENDLSIQEFMAVPQKERFSDNLVLGNRIFQNLKDIIEKNYGNAALGDEGGFAPQIYKTEQALYLLKNAIRSEAAKIALDAAASQFYQNGKYKIDGREFTDAGLLEFYKDLISRFSIISIEDPFSEEDWNGFQSIARLLRDELIVVGDDLTATNIKRIKEARNKNACNGVILKPNQIGTVTETIEAAKLAKSFGWKTIASHRSGETMDDFIADLAVGLSTDFIKSGSPAKEERMVKYRRLMEIEKELSFGK